MFDEKTVINLLAGGTGGTAGAIATCPLEVIKTRLQSSGSITTYPSTPTILPPGGTHIRVARYTTTCCKEGLLNQIKQIYRNEGLLAFFKGLGPNLVGVAPSRAIYFCAYAQAKSFCNSQQAMTPDTHLVNFCSASFAGFIASSLTNPLWLVKTRVQLDRSKHKGAVRNCIKDVYQTYGLKGFYKGVTASYVGISETVITFVIYEDIKKRLREMQNINCDDHRHSGSTFFYNMVAAALSKSIACSVAYPHEVVRTRLREQGNKYHKFFQTLCLVKREEGRRGLYRGLVTQLIRVIPNTAIMMATYELVVHMLTNNERNGYR